MATTGFKFISLKTTDSQGTAIGELTINPDYIIGCYSNETIGYTVIYTSIPGYPEYKVKDSPGSIVELANAEL